MKNKKLRTIIKNAGNSFIVAKCTEGSSFIDKYYAENIANAKELEQVYKWCFKYR